MNPCPSGTEGGELNGAPLTRPEDEETVEKAATTFSRASWPLRTSRSRVSVNREGVFRLKLSSHDCGWLVMSWLCSALQSLLLAGGRLRRWSYELMWILSVIVMQYIDPACKTNHSFHIHLHRLVLSVALLFLLLSNYSFSRQIPPTNRSFERTFSFGPHEWC